MHPALSVIFFTTLSGAGYGLLAWTGATLCLLALRDGLSPPVNQVQLWGLGLGLALSTVGLLCSLAHLGRPARAWRALSQWRTSWLSREGVLALATPLPALAAGMLLLRLPEEAGRAPAIGVLGALLALCALATVACTAMIYASLRPIPAWRHPLVLPVYLLFALVTGFALHLLLVAALLPGQALGGMLLLLVALGLVLALAKGLYWRDLDAAPAPASRGAAVGLPEREVRVFERPHTEANYITREMAFAVARRHATRLRVGAVLGLAGLPALAAGLAASGLLSAVAGAALAAVALLGAAFVERWLFFAQARHVVAAYY